MKTKNVILLQALAIVSSFIFSPLAAADKVYFTPLQVGVPKSYLTPAGRTRIEYTQYESHLDQELLKLCKTKGFKGYASYGKDGNGFFAECVNEAQACIASSEPAGKEGKHLADEVSKISQWKECTPSSSSGSSNKEILASSVKSESIPCAQCFPFEELKDQKLKLSAEILLTHILRGASLYTFLGGLKPATETNAIHSFSKALDGLSEEQIEKIKQVFTCTKLLDIRFTQNGTFEVKRLDKLAEVERDNQVFLEKQKDHYNNLTMKYGLSRGYPQHAVQAFLGIRGERDAVRIPNIMGKTGDFNYAVPKGHILNDADKKILSKAATIRKIYQEQMNKIILPELQLRALFDDGNGNCSPQNGDEKVR